MSFPQYRYAVAGAAALFLFLSGPAPSQGLNPGPYEILPFDDAYIIEAFTDLRGATSDIADWTGWTSSSWESPNAYNNHGGTDFSVGAGVPIRAICNGTVIEVRNDIPDNNHSINYYGNYVKIRPDGASPLGEQLTVLTAHMQPGSPITVGQTVTTGQYLGTSGNTGNSTSEHSHVESALLSGGQVQCGFYHGNYKYPVMFNPTATKQVGHVLRVDAPNAAIRSDNRVSASQIATAAPGMLLYASFAKRGYYRVFLPNQSVRSGWISATEVSEVFDGTVIQPLPDAGAYVHSTQLLNKYNIRSTPDAGGAILGTINWAGGRFVADQTAAGGWYRIPVPGQNTWGWVQANNRMVVYPQVVNPTINLAAKPNDQFPMVNAFTQLGLLDYGRPKFDRRSVVDFDDNPGDSTPARRVLLLTDNGNTGDGHNESVSYGRPEHGDYYVQADVYLQYRPAYDNVSWTTGYQRYGVFLRDDGFGGFDETFEGRGNCYLMMYNAGTGQVFCGKSVNATLTAFATSTITSNAWATMRIEAEGNNIRYYLNGNLMVSQVDTEFSSGLCGMNYTGRLRNAANTGNRYPAERGAYFDNFIADALPGSGVADWELYP